MSDRTKKFQSPTGARGTLRRMPVPAAVAYVLVTVLTLLAQGATWMFALLAEISDRLADAGESARLTARGAVVVTVPSPVRTATASGGAR